MAHALWLAAAAQTSWKYDHRDLPTMSSKA